MQHDQTDFEAHRATITSRDGADAALTAMHSAVKAWGRGEGRRVGLATDEAESVALLAVVGEVRRWEGTPTLVPAVKLDAALRIRTRDAIIVAAGTAVGKSEYTARVSRELAAEVRRAEGDEQAGAAAWEATHRGRRAHTDWLTQIVPLDDDFDLTSPTPTPEDAAVEADTAARWGRALETRLTAAQQRTTAALLACAGRQAEAARTLGTTKQAVSKQAVAIRARLAPVRAELVAA